MNTFGKYFRVTTFGESHGKALGVVVDGCPSNISFSKKILENQLERRRPGRFSWQTSRKEPDIPIVLSGVYEGKTLGTPIAMIVMNKDARSQDYKKIKDNPRKGHADDVWKDKFGNYDYRGGGRASGRETLSRVMGGAIAQMFLNQVSQKLSVLTYISQIGSIQIDPNELVFSSLWDQKNVQDEDFIFGLHREKAKEIKSMLELAKKEGKSYGGIVNIKIRGIPKGLGQPVFNKLKSDFASSLLGIGSSFSFSVGSYLPLEKIASLEGSKFHEDESHYGGLRGGISTGEDIQMQMAFKPPSSLNLVAKQGRHDPCIIPRVISVVESMIYLVLADHVLAQRLDRA